MITAPEVLSAARLLITAVDHFDQSWTLSEPLECGTAEAVIVMIEKNQKKYYITIRKENPWPFSFKLEESASVGFEKRESEFLLGNGGDNAVKFTSLNRLLTMISLLEAESSL